MKDIKMWKESKWEENLEDNGRERGKVNQTMPFPPCTKRRVGIVYVGRNNEERKR